MDKYNLFPKPAMSCQRSALGALLLGVILFSRADSCASEVRRTPLIIKDGGSPENPSIFDGRGMVIDLGEDISAALWEIAGDIWTLRSLPEKRVPIIAGQYAALFIDEQPISVPRNLQAEAAHPDRKSRCYFPAEQLKPGQAGFSEEGALYFRWPEGKVPGKSRIILPPKEGVSAVSIACSHVIVRNITAKYASNDGFNIHGRWVGIVLEDIKALCNGDEGISAHDTVEMTVRRAEVAWNGSASGGIADVNQCVTSYEECLVHDNAGAAFYFSGKSHSVTRSHIYHQKRDFDIPKESMLVTSEIRWDRE
jgi:hypothetical protein